MTTPTAVVTSSIVRGCQTLQYVSEPLSDDELECVQVKRAEIEGLSRAAVTPASPGASVEAGEEGTVAVAQKPTNPIIHVYAYVEDGQPAIEYNVAITEEFNEVTIFEPFGVAPNTVVASFSPGHNEDEWTVCELDRTPYIFDILKDGEKFIWVKDGLSNLPGIDTLTGGVGVPPWDPYQAGVDAWEKVRTAAREVLTSRGLPTEWADIDEYIIFGTPDNTDNESNTADVD
ncbi:hypothetical protein C8T65DRAFT_744783 [Cerioporus squamosus]|nr:hypothetical protein C8T65DRAFT_744783 [Cerioporus squamosus]